MTINLTYYELSIEVSNKCIAWCQDQQCMIQGNKFTEGLFLLVFAIIIFVIYLLADEYKERLYRITDKKLIDFIIRNAPFLVLYSMIAYICYVLFYVQ